MTLQFGSGVAQSFTSAPTAGTPSIAIGDGTFGGGAAPDFQGTSALGVNMATGYTDALLDLQIAGISRFAVTPNGAGGILSLPTAGLSYIKFGSYIAAAFAASSGQIFSDTLANDGVVRGSPGTSVRMGVSGSGSGESTFVLATDQATVFSTLASVTPFRVHGIASQTADLITLEDSASVGQFSVANAGSAGSPIWALRVAPTANASGMVQAHVGGSSTGRAIQVIDNTGTSLGWLQLVS